MEQNENEKRKEENAMVSADTRPSTFSLAEFILANKSKIEKITPKNPPIKMDDEWRNEDFWDKLSKEKSGK